MKTIFKAIVGSQSYGTALPTSDIDYKGVYVQDSDDILSFKYKEQIDKGKDECYYEVRRFLQLLQSANPTVMELLFSPEDCIVEKTPEFDLIVAHRDRFLTKKCRDSFGGYAHAQITRAKGLNKKMNYEKVRMERKTPMDFCYFYEDGKTFPLVDFFEREKMKQQFCGLAALNHFKDCYALYYDYSAEFGEEANRESEKSKAIGYRGIQFDDGNDVHLSNIPKYARPQTIIFYNKDAYSMHCKDYREYKEWLDKRNTDRYVDVKNHNQKIDGKNLLHCRRLLDMAKEIALTGHIEVRRPNREYLLSIRRGEMNLDTIISEAEKDLKELDVIYEKCDLPKEVDSDFVNNLLLQVRHF
jgi:hypothetical protein